MLGIIVFEDSTVDDENNNQIPTILRINFKPYDCDFVGGINKQFEHNTTNIVAYIRVDQT